MYLVIIVIPAPRRSLVDLFLSGEFPNTKETQQTQAHTIYSRPHLDRNNRRLIIAIYNNTTRTILLPH